MEKIEKYEFIVDDHNAQGVALIATLSNGTRVHIADYELVQIMKEAEKTDGFFMWQAVFHTRKSNGFFDRLKKLVG